MSLKKLGLLMVLMSSLLAGASVLNAAPLGSGFTYQGQLKKAGVPIAGPCDLQFSLWDADSGGNPVGLPVTVFGVSVVNGLFTVELPFAAEAFNGDARWMQVAVRSPAGSGTFTTLSPRQKLTAAPYANYALGPWLPWSGGGLAYYAGSVGIGAAPSTSPLTVAGLIESVADGFKFPDGTIQTTAAAGGGGLGGSGTAGYLSKFTGTSTLGNSSVFESGSNIGIGTTAPQEKLHVLGAGVFDFQATGKLTVGTPLGTGPGLIAYAPNGHRREVGFRNGDIAFGLSATSGASAVALVILENRNVGIGTGTPLSPLHVEGSIAGEPQLGVVSVVNTAVNDHGNTPAIYGTHDNTDAWGVGVKGQGGYTGILGQNHPTGSSQYYGTIGYVDSRYAGATAVNVGSLGEASGRGTNIGLYGSAEGTEMGNSTNNYGVYGTASGWGANYAGYFDGRAYFSGNVGIGTTDPQQVLHVAGLSRFDVGGGSINISTPGGNPGLITYAANGHRRDMVSDDYGLRLLAGNSASPPSTGIDIRESGNVGISRWDAQYPLHVGTDATNGNGAHVTAGGMWTNGSDRNSKKDFRPVDKQEVLAKVATLPIDQWRYKTEADAIRHVGPTAQDFHDAFHLGDSNRHIGTIDADGVALVAIQALNDVVKDKDAKIASLESRVKALEEMVARLGAERSGGAR